MIDKIKNNEYLNSIFDNFEYKVKNPFIAAFFISWVFFNWKLIFIILNLDKDICLNCKINILTNYISTNHYNTFWFPLAIGILTPFINFFVTNISKALMTITYDNCFPWIIKRFTNKLTISKDTFEKTYNNLIFYRVKFIEVNANYEELNVKNESLNREIEQLKNSAEDYSEKLKIAKGQQNIKLSQTYLLTNSLKNPQNSDSKEIDLENKLFRSLKFSFEDLNYYYRIGVKFKPSNANIYNKDKILDSNSTLIHFSKNINHEKQSITIYKNEEIVQTYEEATINEINYFDFSMNNRNELLVKFNQSFILTYNIPYEHQESLALLFWTDDKQSDEKTIEIKDIRGTAL